MKNPSAKIFLAASALLVIFLGFRFAVADPGTAGGVKEPYPATPELTPALAPDAPVENRQRAPEGISGSGAFRRTAWTPPPALTAEVALVADPADGGSLYELAPAARWPVASLTKLMTAEIVATGMDLNLPITLEPSDFYYGGNELTRELEAGDTYARNDLLRVMLISSSNEAAEAFARVFGRNRFIDAMNARAAQWGLKDTHFSDPSGISAGNQSTANDFKRLALRVYADDPGLLATTKRTSVSVTEQNSRVVKTFSNTNQFAGRADFLGGKTGTTPEAGENLLTFFSYQGHPVMILVLGSADRYGETAKLFSWFTHDFSSGN